MRSLLKTVATRAVTTVPRLALQAAGMAWNAGEGLASRVLPRADSDPEPTITHVKVVRPDEQAPRATTPAPNVTNDEPAPPHDALPLEDYDHLTVGALRTRVRELDLVDVRKLHSFELAHAHRLPVVTILANRIAKLEREQRTTTAR